MAENNGYVLLAKSMQEKEFYSNSKDVHVFIECIFRTNWKDHAVFHRGYRLEPGQFAFGRKEMGEKLGMDEYAVYRSIKKLEKQGRITVKAHNKLSIGTTVNYRTYQDTNYYIAQRAHNSCTTDAQQMHTNEAVKQLNSKTKKEKKAFFFPLEYPVDEWYSFETKLKSVNPDLDLKQIIGFKKKSLSVFKAGKSLEGFFDFEIEKNTKREIKLPEGLKSNDFKRLLEHRKKNKQPVDNIALYKLSLKLLKMHSEGYDTLSVIEETIDNNWKGFFPKEHHLRRSL